MTTRKHPHPGIADPATCPHCGVPNLDSRGGALTGRHGDGCPRKQGAQARPGPTDGKADAAEPLSKEERAAHMATAARVGGAPTVVVKRYEATVSALESELAAVRAERDGLRMRLDVGDGRVKDARIMTWALRNDLGSHPHLQKYAEDVHAMLARTYEHAAPEWNYSLAGYVPAEGDWVLTRNHYRDRVVKEKLITERDRIRRDRDAAFIDTRGEFVAGGWCQVGRLLAYYRPPGPPPVPEGE